MLLEEWTREARKDAANEKLFTLTLSGSKTGPDGEGRSDAKFVSKSGRVVIEPEDTAVWSADCERSGPVSIERRRLIQPIADGCDAPSQYEVHYEYANGETQTTVSTLR